MPAIVIQAVIGEIHRDTAAGLREADPVNGSAPGHRHLTLRPAPQIPAGVITRLRKFPIEITRYCGIPKASPEGRYDRVIIKGIDISRTVVLQMRDTLELVALIQLFDRAVRIVHQSSIAGGIAAAVAARRDPSEGQCSSRRIAAAAPLDKTPCSRHALRPRQVDLVTALEYIHIAAVILHRSFRPSVNRGFPQTSFPYGCPTGPHVLYQTACLRAGVRGHGPGHFPACRRPGSLSSRHSPYGCRSKCRQTC